MASCGQILQAVIRTARVSSQGLTRERSASKLKCSLKQYLVDSGPGSVLINVYSKFLSVWFPWDSSQGGNCLNQTQRDRQMKDRGREAESKEKKRQERKRWSEKEKQKGREKELIYTHNIYLYP